MPPVKRKQKRSDVTKKSNCMNMKISNKHDSSSKLKLKDSNVKNCLDKKIMVLKCINPEEVKKGKDYIFVVHYVNSEDSISYNAILTSKNGINRSIDLSKENFDSASDVISEQLNITDASNNIDKSKTDSTFITSKPKSGNTVRKNIESDGQETDISGIIITEEETHKNNNKVRRKTKLDCTIPELKTKNSKSSIHKISSVDEKINNTEDQKSEIGSEIEKESSKENCLQNSENIADCNVSESIFPKLLLQTPDPKSGNEINEENKRIQIEYHVDSKLSPSVKLKKMEMNSLSKISSPTKIPEKTKKNCSKPLVPFFKFKLAQTSADKINIEDDIMESCESLPVKKSGIKSHCEICDHSFSSAAHYKRHLLSRKHTTKSM